MLDRAIWNGDAHQVHTALMNGADANQMVVPPTLESVARRAFGFGPKSRNRALVTAAIRGDREVVKELINAGANPDGHDGTGFTALVAAMKNGNLDICRFLLQHGANPNPKFKDNSSFVDEATPAEKALLTEASSRKS